MSAIFGGSKSKQQAQNQSQQSSQSTSSSMNQGENFSNSQQQSFNQAYPFLQETFGGTAGRTEGANSAIANLLGLGDAAAGRQSLENYKNSAGFQSALEGGQRAITGSAAARGMLNSGSTLKGLASFGSNLANQHYNDYLGQLMGLGNQGIQAGGLIGSAGNRSEGSSNSYGYNMGQSNSQSTSQGTSSGSSSGSSSEKPGLGAFLGQAAGSIAMSDPKAKKNVFRVGELKNGLGLYQYRYNDGSGPFVGVMADEVEKIQPEALGPVIDGYKTVDYSKIEGV